MTDQAPALLQPELLRSLFPVLQQQVKGQPLAYLDNAATTQTPLPVQQAMLDFEQHDRANIHRGVHTYIAPGARDANVHQRLWGIALDGQPRLILRPHLEILHDQVAAVHGATWGALPEDALFYAQQRGLAPDTARSLIIEGKARALLERALPNIESDGEGEASSSLLSAWLEGDWLPQAINAHLAATTLQESA